MNCNKSCLTIKLHSNKGPHKLRESKTLEDPNTHSFYTTIIYRDPTNIGKVKMMGWCNVYWLYNTVTLVCGVEV